MYLFLIGLYVFFVFIKLESGSIQPKGGKAAKWWYGFGGGKY